MWNDQIKRDVDGWSRILGKILTFLFEEGERLKRKKEKGGYLKAVVSCFVLLSL